MGILKIIPFISLYGIANCSRNKAVSTMTNLLSLLHNIFALKWENDAREETIIFRGILQDEMSLGLRLPSLSFWIQLMTVSEKRTS